MNRTPQSFLRHLRRRNRSTEQEREEVAAEIKDSVVMARRYAVNHLLVRGDGQLLPEIEEVSIDYGSSDEEHKRMLQAQRERRQRFAEQLLHDLGQIRRRVPARSPQR